MSQSIIRVARRDRDFTICPNAVIRDTRLSFKARGLLISMLADRDDWTFYVSELTNRSDKDGVTAIRSAIKELEEAGYMVRRQTRNELGHIGYETVVYDYPHGAAPAPAKPAPATKPKPAKPAPAAQPEAAPGTDDDTELDLSVAGRKRLVRETFLAELDALVDEHVDDRRPAYHGALELIAEFTELDGEQTLRVAEDPAGEWAKCANGLRQLVVGRAFADWFGEDAEFATPLRAAFRVIRPEAKGPQAADHFVAALYAAIEWGAEDPVKYALGVLAKKRAA